MPDARAGCEPLYRAYSSKTCRRRGSWKCSRTTSRRVRQGLKPEEVAQLAPLSCPCRDAAHGCPEVLPQKRVGRRVRDLPGVVQKPPEARLVARRERPNGPRRVFRIAGRVQRVPALKMIPADRLAAVPCPACLPIAGLTGREDFFQAPTASSGRAGRCQTGSRPAPRRSACRRHSVFCSSSETRAPRAASPIGSGQPADPAANDYNVHEVSVPARG